MKMMIQKLLADRFQLKFHFEKKELSVYAITIAKTAAKITKSQDDPNNLAGGMSEAVHGERRSRSETRHYRKSPPCCKTRWINQWWTSQAFPKSTTSQ